MHVEDDRAVPIRFPSPPFEPNRILQVTLPPSDVPTVLVIECEASPEVARTIKVRVYRGG